MWEIQHRGGDEIPGLIYREASFKDLVASDFSPIQFLGHILGIRGEVLTKLDEAIPTWLRPEEIHSSHIKVFQSQSKDQTVAVEVVIPQTEEVAGWVWIDQSFVLIQKPAGITELEIVYTVSDEDHERAIRLESKTRGPSNATLEWYGTIGLNTTVVAGESPLKGPGRVKRAFLLLSEKSGVLIGRIVRNRSTALSKRTTDPLRESRKSDLEARDRELATQIPEFTPDFVSSLNDNDKSQLVVLVHGTFSCGMRIAAALKESNIWPGRDSVWVRYEHDTFLPISDNASELAHLVKYSYSQFERILFVCHSRGGLVGVTAASQLDEDFTRQFFPYKPRERSWPNIKIEVCTFGTPHLGTPIAAGAESISSVLRAIAKTSSRMAFKSLGLDPAGWAAGWAIGRISFPRGVSGMSPDSDFIAMYRLQARRFLVAVAGGYFDPGCNSDGYFAVAKRGALNEIMEGKAHDGVVPLHSCIGTGDQMCEPARQCGHCDYFSRDDTLVMLRKRLAKGSWD